MTALVDAVRAAIDAGTAGLRVSLVATVESYDPAKGVVNVRPDVPRLGEDGTAERWPVLYELPVSFPGSSSVQVSYAIPKGSRGWIVFHDLPLDGWKQGESEPRGRRSHALSDGVFVPGIGPLGSRTLASSGMDITADAVGIGKASGRDGVVRKSDLQAAIDALKSYVDTLIVDHTHVASGSTTTGGTPTAFPAKPTAQSSTTVKVS